MPEGELLRVKQDRLEGGGLAGAILRSKKTDIGNAYRATLYSSYSLGVSLESKRKATLW